MANNKFKSSNAQLKNLPRTRNTNKAKKDLLSYLSTEYGIVIFDKLFMRKLEMIHNGQLENMVAPISYSTILDMFIHFKPRIDAAKAKARAKGGVITPIHRMNYDLAILLNKHAEYLEYLNQETVVTSNLQTIQETSARLTEIASKNARQTNDKEGVDIAQMLEDW